MKQKKLTRAEKEALGMKKPPLTNYEIRKRRRAGGVPLEETLSPEVRERFKEMADT